MLGPIVRTKAFWQVLGAYAIALVPAAVMTMGAVLLIEMSYRVATQPELGTRMRIAGVAVDAAAAWSWITAVTLLAGGFYVFRRTWPAVTAAWNRATEEARAAGAAAQPR
jgi:hypothetical protein